jgi:hypothetical protein
MPTGEAGVERNFDQPSAVWAQPRLGELLCISSTSGSLSAVLPHRRQSALLLLDHQPLTPPSRMMPEDHAVTDRSCAGSSFGSSTCNFFRSDQSAITLRSRFQDDRRCVWPARAALVHDGSIGGRHRRAATPLGLPELSAGTLRHRSGRPARSRPRGVRPRQRRESATCAMCAPHSAGL